MSIAQFALDIKNKIDITKASIIERLTSNNINSLEYHKELIGYLNALNAVEKLIEDTYKEWIEPEKTVKESPTLY